MTDEFPDRTSLDSALSGGGAAAKAEYEMLGHEIAGNCFVTEEELSDLREELIWNARLHHARSPDGIIRPGTAEDVAKAIRFAGSRGLKVSLRGSGHNYQAAALRDGGLLIDLGALDTIDIDVAARRARIGAGVKGGRLMEELAPHGLAFPIGHCSDVAASGYILSGGIGWNYGEWGPACTNVAAIQMITADGQLCWVNEEAHPDLFWAAKGAGCAFFAAVTGYELELQPLPARSFALDAVFEAQSAPAIARWLSTAGLEADPTVELICMVGPDHETGKPSVTIRAIASGSTAQEAKGKLAGLLDVPADARRIAPVDARELEFADLTQFSAMPTGKRVAADQIWSEAPLWDLLLAVQHLAEGPQSSSAISLTALGGRARTPRMPEGKSGSLSVGGVTSAGIYAMWDGAAEDSRHLAWVAAAGQALAPYKCGRYIGEADLFIEPGRLEECFSTAALARLKDLKARYDPTSLFFSCLP